MAKAKFNIGDTVYNKVEKKGSFEPTPYPQTITQLHTHVGMMDTGSKNLNLCHRMNTKQLCKHQKH